MSSTGPSPLGRSEVSSKDFQLLVGDTSFTPSQSSLPIRKELAFELGTFETDDGEGTPGGATARISTWRCG